MGNPLDQSPVWERRLFFQARKLLVLFPRRHQGYLADIRCQLGSGCDLQQAVPPTDQAKLLPEPSWAVVGIRGNRICLRAIISRYTSLPVLGWALYIGALSTMANLALQGVTVEREDIDTGVKHQIRLTVTQ